MTRLLLLVLVVAGAIGPTMGQSNTPMVARPNAARILFIPLDDRPPCLQFTVRMGLIGNAHVVAPPVALLGRFTTPGQSDRIINWLEKQDVRQFDAAIVSLDMLAYGGLVASRVHHIDVAQALRRVDAIARLRKRAPNLKIYAQSVVMRLAPTADGKNEAYRAKLADWAELSVATDSASKARTARLEQEIPAQGLADYKQARQRNLHVNQRAVDLVKADVIDYLLLSQDDAKPQGVHVADRETLIAEIKKLKLTDKIAVQPGADEVSMLLLARALNQRNEFLPKVKAVYSSDALANAVMPFEDKPLRQTVSLHIRATGSTEVANDTDADVLFYVFASRKEAGRAAAFANEIARQLAQKRRVIVADIDPKGDVQGGDTDFTKALESRNLLPELSSYASWNTAGNTIGTALPQGVIFTLAEHKLLTNKAVADRIWTAQNWFLLHRVLDDYYFHNLVRAKANQFVRQEGRSSALMTDDTRQRVEAYSLNLLKPAFASLSRQFIDHIPNPIQPDVHCAEPTSLTFTLPWNRTFEANIDFELKCINSVPRAPVHRR